MSQCVPSWDLDDGPSHHLQSHHPSSTITRSPMSDCEVAELTWENGRLAMHGHRGGTPRAGKPPAKDPSTGVPSWEKPRASGTLEAVVDQATRSVVPSAPAAAAHVPNSASSHLVPCLGAKNSHHPLRAPRVPATMDALVPCSNLRPHGGSRGDEPQPCRLVPDEAPGTADGGGGACVASCTGRKRTRLGAGDGNCSVTGSVASMGLTFDTCEINGAGDDTGIATSASPIDGSPETENTSCGRPRAHADDYDSVCHSRRTQRDGCYEEEKTKGDMGRSSISTKRSRAAAVHNQSERKRRDRINQKMKTLQKLVPNSSKTDKASILDETIEYLKQLQAQVQMMSRMSSVPHMMMPMTMQHMQMAMMAQMAHMAQMGMGMGMGMGMMDMNTLGRVEQSGVAPVLSTAPPFVPPSVSWPEAPHGDRLQAPAGGAVLPGDPFAPFMAASQNQQPTTMDAYGRMAALHRQLYQQPPGPTS